MSAPEGFEFRAWDTGLECLACGGVIDGIGQTIKQLADFHRERCNATHPDKRSFAELTDPDIAKAADEFRAANLPSKDAAA